MKRSYGETLKLCRESCHGSVTAELLQPCFHHRFSSNHRLAAVAWDIPSQQHLAESFLNFQLTKVRRDDKMIVVQVTRLRGDSLQNNKNSVTSSSIIPHLHSPVLLPIRVLKVRSIDSVLFLQSRHYTVSWSIHKSWSQGLSVIFCSLHQEINNPSRFISLSVYIQIF